MKEDKIEVELNQEEVQAIIDCYEKDLKYIKKLEKENQQLHNKIDKAMKYVSQLSSKGRDCEIYWDIKQEILKILKDSDVDV